MTRKCVRGDGWSPEVQRGFVGALAVRGSVWQAAAAVGRTESGAYKVRASAGAESFAAAWDKAVSLYHRRNPQLEQRGRPPRGVVALPSAPPKPEYFTPQEFVDRVLKKYWIKLKQERDARLEGRIVEADFLVRQMSWMEVVLDLCGGAPELMRELKRGGKQVGDIVATPLSVLLDDLRRAAWRRLGEPERPPLAPLGRHNDEIATGEPPESQHWRERDGEGFGQTAEHLAYLQRNAKAQRAWEAKAKADADAWRERLEREAAEAAGPSGPAPEEDGAAGAAAPKDEQP